MLHILQVPIVFADAFLRKQDLSYIANIDSSSHYAGDYWDLGNQAVGLPRCHAVACVLPAVYINYWCKTFMCLTHVHASPSVMPTSLQYTCPGPFLRTMTGCMHACWYPEEERLLLHLILSGVLVSLRFDVADLLCVQPRPAPERQ